jgi:gluconolactonase
MATMPDGSRTAGRNAGKGVALSGGSGGTRADIIGTEEDAADGGISDSDAGASGGLQDAGVSAEAAAGHGGRSGMAGVGGEAGAGGMQQQAGAAGRAGNQHAGAGGEAGAQSAGAQAGMAAGSVAQSAGAGGAAGSHASVPYPPLDVSTFGVPVRIATSQSLQLAEGPLWDPCGQRLLFSDVTPSTIYALSIDDQLSVFATNTHNTNGLAFDRDGALILAQMGRPGHIGRLDKAGNFTTLEPAGSALHTPDDVIVRSDGTIYFTDGDFPPTGGLTLGPLPVYAFKPGAMALQNGGTVRGPNGIELSPDEKTLYVDAYFAGSVVKFTVAEDGTLTKGATLASGLTGADSLCLDDAGNLYVGVSGGLQILSPDGSKLGLIPVRSSQGVTNCTFGGEDGKTLYITAWTSIWKLTGMPIAGLEWRKNRERLTCQSDNTPRSE